MIRGNHDYWWASKTKMRGALPQGCEILDGSAIVIDGGVGIAGTRLWTLEEDPEATEDDIRIYRRELGRLERALAELDRLNPSRRIAMTHYPPTTEQKPSAAEALLQKHGVTQVIYGHLHGEEEHQRALRGLHRGIEYTLTSADFLGFTPTLILDDENLGGTD